MAIDRTQLLTICDVGDFAKLVGEVENLVFDCKAMPYIFTDEKGRREIAKDVSAFANSVGGEILLGVKTQPSTTHFGDEAVSVNPFAQSLVNITQYNDVLSAWIYPEIPGLAVKWKLSSTDSAKGIVIINIPPHAVSSKPFLIAKTLDGTKIVESVFGYAARKSDTSPPLGVKELQQHLNAGLSYDSNLDGRLGAIEASVKALLGNSDSQAHAKALATHLSSAISSALMHGDLGRVFN
ncbi:MAG: hypothetical protein RL274_761 [Pseudomonadota bacterium]|jgi:predicted HTH transcriptional regulator